MRAPETRTHRRGMWIFLLILVPVLALLAPRSWALWRTAGFILPADQVPPSKAAIVFGAGLRRDGQPTAVLADRVATAADLYHAGRVSQLVLSGTVRPGHDEPASMRDLAVQLGVPETSILLDPSGSRTFDTCLFARERFGSASVVLVSQAYHLPRALVTCLGLGVEAHGVAADRRSYQPTAEAFWVLREYPATLVALVDTYLLPKPDPGVSVLTDVERDSDGS
jgi:vancomycin permeability regulator SanA